MHRTRLVSTILIILLASLGGHLFYRLNVHYVKETAAPGPDYYDPLVIWIAKHPRRTTGAACLLLAILGARFLPWEGAAFVAAVSLILFFILWLWLKFAAQRISWIKAALAAEQQRLMAVAERPHTDTPKHVQAVELLLKNKVDINYKNEKGMTPLHLAAAGGHNEAVDLLLRNGALVNIQDSRGVTPLMMAAIAGFVGTVKMLIEKGADLSLADLEGHKALDYAKKNQKDKSIVDVITHAIRDAEVAAKAKAAADAVKASQRRS
jgi:hypothetical protein